MKRLIALFLVLMFITPAYAQDNVRPIYDNGTGDRARPVDLTHGLPVQLAPTGSATTPSTNYSKFYGTTTYTKSTISLNGSSQTLLAASNTRTAVMIYNPTTNSNVWIDVSGGTAVSEGGMLIPAGYTVVLSGSVTPKTAITVIGTNTQSLIVHEGN